ncbi:protein of unknown function [Cupriavidus taiwanensis]|nr:protein of unknown function [Cupriavidus taiwanensis]
MPAAQYEVVMPPDLRLFCLRFSDRSAMRAQVSGAVLQAGSHVAIIYPGNIDFLFYPGNIWACSFSSFADLP